MTGSPLLKGWLFSLCLHTAFVAGAMWVVTERSSQLPKQVFRLDVTLVEDSEPGQVHASTPTEPKTDAESAATGGGDIKPDVPIERKGITSVKSSSPLEHEAEERQVVDTDVLPQRARPTPAQFLPLVEVAKPIGERGVSTESVQGVIKGINSSKTRTRSNTRASVVTEEEPSGASLSGVIAGVTADLSKPSPAARSLTSSAQQTASDPSIKGDKVAPQPAPTLPSLVVAAHTGPPAKTDFGWLAKTMYRRITELKRYPRAARVHHWEGKVVLRAVIKHDGHLAELSLERSSGYDLLDQEAMDLVRQVCPLPLERTLGRPYVVMYVPITYTLEN